MTYIMVMLFYCVMQGEVIKLNWKTRLLLVFEDPNSSILSRIIAVIIMVLILLSCCSFILSTVDRYRYVPGAARIHALLLLRSLTIHNTYIFSQASTSNLHRACMSAH